METKVFEARVTGGLWELRRRNDEESKAKGTALTMEKLEN